MEVLVFGKYQRFANDKRKGGKESELFHDDRKNWPILTPADLRVVVDVFMVELRFADCYLHKVKLTSVHVHSCISCQERRRICALPGFGIKNNLAPSEPGGWIGRTIRQESHDFVAGVLATATQQLVATSPHILQSWSIVSVVLPLTTAIDPPH